MEYYDVSDYFEFYLDHVSDTKCMELIVTGKKRGAGTRLDPYRDVLVVYTKEGEFVAEQDPCSPWYEKRGGKEVWLKENPNAGDAIPIWPRDEDEN